MDTAAEVRRQMARIRRCAADIISEAELESKLARSIESGTPLRVKLGLDPTAPDIHIGNAVPLQSLATFQKLGHAAVLIIGDYTATVGDPSGVNTMRPQLTHEEVMVNAQTYIDQADRILDVEKMEIVRNGDWFSKMTFADVIKLAAKLTVARCIERDDFAKRLAEGRPIGVHETLYPLMQAYDSVVVRSDVELGGTDQLFNILLGRDLQRDAGMEPQVVITNELLVGLDGAMKMSKSKGNYIGICEAPETIFGKAMSIPDEMMRNYFVLTTDLPDERIELLLAPGVHPREAKAALAAAIVERYYDADAAARAGQAFDRVFKQRGLPDDMPETVLGAADLDDGSIWIVRLLQTAGLAASGGEARRLVKQGGVRIGPDAESLTVVADVGAQVAVSDGDILKVGKRRFRKLVVR
jgi:tyrosyl-tRNA synthetase